MRRLLRSWSEQWKTRRVGEIDKCKEEREQLKIQYKPSLFQHIGTHSSLKGKVSPKKYLVILDPHILLISSDDRLSIGLY